MWTRLGFYFILFYFILFYFILFYFILFYIFAVLRPDARSWPPITELRGHTPWTHHAR